MKYHIVLALSFLTGGAVCGSALSKRVASTRPLLSSAATNATQDTCATNDLNLPPHGMMGRNGIYWGFLPDDSSGGGTAYNMTTINCRSGKYAST